MTAPYVQCISYTEKKTKSLLVMTRKTTAKLNSKLNKRLMEFVYQMIDNINTNCDCSMFGKFWRYFDRFENDSKILLINKYSHKSIAIQCAWVYKENDSFWSCPQPGRGTHEMNLYTLFNILKLCIPFYKRPKWTEEKNWRQSLFETVLTLDLFYFFNEYFLIA